MSNVNYTICQVLTYINLLTENNRLLGNTYLLLRRIKYKNEIPN